MSSPGPVERIASSTLVTITGIVADVSAVAALLLSEDVRVWIKRNPLLVFWIAVALLALSVLLANRLTAHIRSLRRELTLRGEQISDLELRLHPTERDKATFTEALELFPLNDGLILFLSFEFSGKKWRGSDVAVLWKFANEWEGRFFDDPTAQQAFKELYDRCAELAHLLASEGGRDPDVRIGPDQNPHYSIGKPQEYKDGYPEFEKVRHTILEAANSIVLARRSLEKVGRARGL